MTSPAHDPFGPPPADVAPEGPDGPVPASPSVQASSYPREVLEAYKEQARRRGVYPPDRDPA